MIRRGRGVLGLARNQLRRLYSRARGAVGLVGIRLLTLRHPAARREGDGRRHPELRRILLVGPGLMPIPTPGWGAVETVIWQQKVHLEQLGLEVQILNERGLRAALDSRPWEFDLVHLHYDELAPLWNVLARRFGFDLAVTTHYGYAAWPDRWDSDFRRLFKAVCRTPLHIALSPAIARVVEERRCGAAVRVIPNGTEVRDIAFRPGGGNGRAICIGKIEPRKRQAAIARLCGSAQLAVDFVGPVVTPDFEPDGEFARHLGEWGREDVHGRLTEYSALLLSSNGEAHPLVVLEGMAAGLSIVVSPEAAGNLDVNLPWISVCPTVDDRLVEAMRAACDANERYRQAIREHASEVWDWGRVAQRYAAGATALLEDGR